jgi:hypothetical protein
MRKAICILIIYALGMSNLFGQKTEEDDYASTDKKSATDKKIKTPFRERLVYGGNLGGYFGTVSFVQINPMVGYKTTDWWVNGIGLNYIYSAGGGVRQSVFGASVWSRAYIYQSFLLHTEFEQLRRTATDQFGGSYAANVPVWLVGAGYQERAGGLGLSFMVLYDLIQDPDSPYSSPIFRIGGIIGF